MNIVKKTGIALLTAALLAGCNSASVSSAGSSTSSIKTGSDIINLGTTNQMSTLNPLTINWNFVDLYAMSFEFLPLISLNSSYEQESLLTQPVTTDDNLTFNITINDNASWSDGEPVTTDDIIWTILKMTSPAVANQNFDFSMIKGLESGTSEEGADSAEGLVKIDDKHMQIVMNTQMSLSTFINNIGTWICILPSHALKDIADEDLVGNDWFNHPTVVDGPYSADSEDLAHYVSYTANESYFLGAPKIAKINLNVMDGSSLVAALQSGEIDFVQPAIADIPYQDRKTLTNLSNVTTTYSDPITSEMTFFNTHNISDARIRKAIVEAIDRSAIVKSLLPDNGEVTDGFVCKSSQYYDSSKETISYDPEDAKKLLKEAGWDNSDPIEYYVNSSDSVLVNAAQIVQQDLAAVGVTVNINTVDFDTLTGQIAGSDEYDMFSVQYTITPIDYYADVNSLVNTVNYDASSSSPYRSWSGDYYNEKLDTILKQTQTATSNSELTDLYTQMDNIVTEDVPVFPLYFLGNSGSVSSRVKNATPSFFGAFNNIQDWELTK
jgi:peptide/nickel transport system substrate-binding protein